LLRGVFSGAKRCCVLLHLRGAAWCCVVLRGAAWCCVVLLAVFADLSVAYRSCLSRARARNPTRRQNPTTIHLYGKNENLNLHNFFKKIEKNQEKKIVWKLVVDF
jgi:hypothetical protein